MVGALRTKKPYDVIAMWHVIEHLPDPWVTLRAANERLNVGGILVLAAPNPNSFQFQTLRRRWPHLDAPRHLMLIPPRVLIETMASAGMQLEMMTTLDEGTCACNLFGWVFFFSNLYPQPGLLNRELRKFGHRLARLVRPIENIEGKGSAYTMLFRKTA